MRRIRLAPLGLAIALGICWPATAQAQAPQLGATATPLKELCEADWLRRAKEKHEKKEKEQGVAEDKRTPPPTAAQAGKLVEYFACDAFVRTRFRDFADSILALRTQIDQQKDRIDDRAEFHWRWLEIWQIVLIGLGAAATLVGAYRDPAHGRTAHEPSQRQVVMGSTIRFASIVIPVAITALTAWSAFRDYRGGYAREFMARTEIATLQGEIEFSLRLGFRVPSGVDSAEPPKLRPITPEVVADWKSQLDKILNKDTSTFLASFAKHK